MRYVYLISVWLHIFCACAWIGGMFFWVAVLMPVLRSAEYRKKAPALVQLNGQRFKTIGWVLLGVMVLTGSCNFFFRGITFSSLGTGDFWESLFGFKIMIIALILMLSGLHDFMVGPEAAQAWRQSPGAPRTRRLRRAASWMGRLNFILALAAMTCGILIVR